MMGKARDLRNQFLRFIRKKITGHFLTGISAGLRYLLDI